MEGKSRRERLTQVRSRFGQTGMGTDGLVHKLFEGRLEIECLFYH